MISVAYGFPSGRVATRLRGKSGTDGIGSWTESGTSGSVGAVGISTLSKRGVAMSFRFATTRQEDVPSAPSLPAHQ